MSKLIAFKLEMISLEEKRRKQDNYVCRKMDLLRLHHQRIH
jgi:hypothetical protein